MAQPVFGEMVRPVVASLDTHSAATSLLCVALYLERCLCTAVAAFKAQRIVSLFGDRERKGKKQKKTKTWTENGRENEAIKD